MKVIRKLLSLFRKRHPRVTLGNVKLGDTKEYLAALAKKSIDEPSLEDAVRMLCAEVYCQDGVSEVSYKYNFKERHFAIGVKTGEGPENIPRNRNSVDIAEINVFANLILQIEAERGRVNEVFSHDMIMSNLNTFIKLGDTYRKHYADKGGQAFVKLAWRFTPKSNTTTKSVLLVRLQLKRKGTNSMFHDYVVSLSEIKNSSVAAT